VEKVFVDTSAWVGLFVANDQSHEKAVSIFEDLKNKKTSLYTSDYVIDETITTILIRGNHKLSVLAGQALLTSNIIETAQVAPAYFQKTWKLYQKYHDKEFSFTDVSSFVIMKDLKIKKAFTFDSDFTKAGLETI
jgi:predicted nucleic acid-binding protein